MRKRSIAALLLLFCIVMALDLLSAAAAGTGTTAKIDEDKNSILTLEYKDGKKALEGAKFYLYQVGTYSWNDTKGAYDFEVTDKFKEAEVTLPSLSFWDERDNDERDNAKKTGEKADALVEYVQKNEGKVSPKDTRMIGNGGTLNFLPQKPGLYLVCGDPAEINGTWYVPQAFLIPLPYPTADGGFSYKVTAKVKHETGAINIVVRTFWVDKDGKNLPDPGPGTTAIVECDGNRVVLDDGNWSYTWNKGYREDWDAYWVADKINGSASGWKLIETKRMPPEVDGGGSTVTIYFHLTFKQVPITITVNKVWVGGGNHPSSVTAQLFCTDCEESKETQLNATNNWTHTWTGLDSDHKWNVIESPVPEGYTATVDKNGNDFTITNTRNSDQPPDEQEKITVKKVWVGGGNHPSSVTVQLFRDGELFDEQVLNSGNGWSHTWTTTVSGHTWSVNEVDVPDGYTFDIAWEGNVATVTNTLESSPKPTPTPTPTPGPNPTPTPVPTPTPNPNPTPTPTPTSTPPGKTPGPGNPPGDPGKPNLPQTSQLWWPVPLLAAAGVVLLLIGAVLFVRKEERGPHE